MANNNTANTIAIGTRVKFQTTHSDGSTITFSARVVKVETDGIVWVEMPAKVRALPFPPLGGKRYGQFRQQDLQVA